MTEEEQKKLEKQYERYNKCRDQELEKFWKNSTFVWCFLLLCFGAFGKILLDYLDLPESDKESVKSDRYLILLAVISYCGFFMSRIWTWMARGLKAWYEVYENAIWDIESNSNTFSFDRRYTIDNYWSVKTNGFNPFDSARYSPSKIVILIGHLLSFAWLIAFGGALYLYYDCNFMDKKLILDYSVNHPNRWLCIFVALAFGVVHICLFFIKSSTLRNTEENKMFWKIRGDMDTKDTIPKEDTTKKIPCVYFEIKDGDIKFFCSNDKGKTIEQYINDNFREICWLRKQWRKISKYFKSTKDADGLLVFQNRILKH